MDSQPWLDAVRQSLARQRLPSEYVQRLLEELTDHLADLKEENMEADAYLRLGVPEQVAKAAASAYRRQSCLGRHPTLALLVFGVSPGLALLAGIALCICGMTILPDGCFESLRRLQPSSAATAWLGSLCLVVIPSIAVTGLYGWLARRSGIGKRWLLLCCAMLAVLAALPMCTAKISGTPGESWLRIGVWRPDSLGHLYYFFIITRIYVHLF